MPVTTRPLSLTLVRHGRSAHAQRGWIDSAGFRAWRSAYEAATIRADERAPAELAQLAGGAGCVVASDAPRAEASARLLASGGPVMLTPLLRELELAAPELGRMKLPLRAWAFAVGGRMLRDRLRGGYPSEEELSRVQAAAGWLEQLGGVHGSVLAVTHASFRSRLAREFEARGWNRAPGRRSLQPWSSWTWTKPG
jgi:broad specificity phosphatase PhoE